MNPIVSCQVQRSELRRVALELRHLLLGDNGKIWFKSVLPQDLPRHGLQIDMRMEIRRVRTHRLP